jgi:signal peptidase I
MERLFAFIGLLFVIYFLGFNLSQIVTGSMSPTLQGESLHDGDWVLTEKITYLFRKPRRWDVVAFVNDEGLQVMKRVVGLPGESVSLNDGQLSINGLQLTRPDSIRSLIYYAYGNLLYGDPVECGDGFYILGDDSKDSQDSRFEGPLDPDRIVGRSWLIVWPPSRIGFVCP